jgi:hypothetical protein
VRNISTWSYQREKAMVLAVDPAVEDQLTLTAIARWTRGANRALGADGLCITARGLKISYDALLDTCIAYAQAAQRSSSVEPSSGQKARYAGSRLGATTRLDSSPLADRALHIRLMRRGPASTASRGHRRAP